MTRRLRILALLAGALILAGPLGGAATAGSRREVKLRFCRPRGRVAPGETVTLALTVRNRARESRELAVEFRYDDREGATFATESLALGPRERRAIDVDCPVPADRRSSGLRVVAVAGEVAVRTRVRIDLSGLPPISDEDWRRGRDLYLQSCARCHGHRGKRFAGRSLSRWRRAIRKGPGDMPRFSELDEESIYLMREYSRDPDRESAKRAWGR